MDSTQPPPDLAKLLTPSLFLSVLENRMPWSRSSVLGFSQVYQHSFSPSRATISSFHELIFPALKALSQYTLSSLPDPYDFLPSPSSHEFPEQALGFQLLLDQGPRSFCEGVDTRWVRGFFDVYSLKFAQSFESLPYEQKPSTWTRWERRLGASFDYWRVTQLWFFAPWVHSETLANQVFISKRIESLRSFVEEVTKTTDPYRNEQERLRHDVYAFPRLYREGPREINMELEKVPELKGEEFEYWLLTVMDVHRPIVERFGRYPYHNRDQGRSSTPEEEKWLEAVNHFEDIDEESAGKILDDIRRGVWSPLGKDYKV